MRICLFMRIALSRILNSHHNVDAYWVYDVNVFVYEVQEVPQGSDLVRVEKDKEVV